MQCTAGFRARAGPVHLLLGGCGHHLLRNHVQYHIFDDDKQLFVSAPVPEVHEVKTVERCVAAIKDWCASRRLRLNDGKTEVIWLGTCGRLQQLAGVELNLSAGVDQAALSVDRPGYRCSSQVY